MTQVRAITLRLLAGKVEQALEVCRKSVLPRITDLEGSLGCHVMCDPAAEELMLLSFWESEAHLRYNDRDGALEIQVGKLAPLIREQPFVSAYELVISS